MNHLPFLPFLLTLLVSIAACGNHSGNADTTTEDIIEVTDPSDDEAIDPHLDSDGDTISDRHEDRDTEVDTDGDTIPDYLDEDSDDDGLPDADEAGDMDPRTAPIDTDNDGTPDFRDEDSDDDGLSDAEETELGMDPYNSDTDLDGVSDDLEIECGSDPVDAGSDCRTLGNAIFIMSYSAPGDPGYPIEPSPEYWHLSYTNEDTGPKEITYELTDDPSDSVDTVAEFIDSVEPDVIGGRPDPGGSLRVCAGGLDVDDFNAPFDGAPDTFTSVPGDTLVCFDIRVKPNTTVPGEEGRAVYWCEINIVEDSISVDTRSLIFIVPPAYTGPDPA